MTMSCIRPKHIVLFTLFCVTEGLIRTRHISKFFTRSSIPLVAIGVVFHSELAISRLYLRFSRIASDSESGIVIIFCHVDICKMRVYQILPTKKASLLYTLSYVRQKAHPTPRPPP